VPRRARGLPDPADYGDLSDLPANQLADWSVQHHHALRAGPHFDVRFGNPDTGLYSWAVPKGLPEPGQRHLAIRQPVHSHGYAGWEGVIPRGYGAGTVSLKDKGQVLVTHSDPDKVHVTTAHKGVPERYALNATGSGRGGHNWLLQNVTPTAPIPFEKKRYENVPQDRAEGLLKNLPEGGVVQPKVDGASVLAQVLKNRLELTSYRQSKRHGGPIVHTERVFGGRPTHDAPKGLHDSILHGELYGTDAGGAIHPGDLGTLLNSGLAKSLARQKEQGIDLKTMLFDVTRRGGVDVPPDTPYSQRRKWLEEFQAHLPRGKFHLAEEARTPEEALNLWNKVRSGKHPLTQEGVVVHPPTGRPQKIKLRDESDVHVTDVFPGEGKYKGVGAGGYHYSLKPGGPNVGKVGTGLSDEMRRLMWEDPESYRGRVARLISQEQLPSGAYRAPAHLSFHEEYPLAPVEKRSAAPDSWVDRVMRTSFATYPPPGIFTRPALDIADASEAEGVAPKGLHSWQRMVLFHKNRGGRRLKPEHRGQLDAAIQMLGQRIRERKGNPGYDPATLFPVPVKEASVNIIDGTIEEAVEALAKRAADLRGRTLTYPEKQARSLSDVLTSVGQYAKDNPLMAQTLGGGALGAGVGTLGTALGNRGKDKDRRQGLLGGALTGALAGGALGGGVGLARKGLQGMSPDPSEGEALKPGQFLGEGGRKMRIDPEVLRRHPELVGKVRDLTSQGPTDWSASKVFGTLQNVAHRALPFGLGRLISNDPDSPDPTKLAPWASSAVPNVALADLALHSKKLHLGDRFGRFGWGMIDPQSSRNVADFRHAVGEAVKKPDEAAGLGFGQQPAKGEPPNYEHGALSEMQRNRGDLLERMARTGRHQNISPINVP
jgi:hypothetical protein